MFHHSNRSLSCSDIYRSVLCGRSGSDKGKSSLLPMQSASHKARTIPVSGCSPWQSSPDRSNDFWNPCDTSLLKNVFSDRNSLCNSMISYNGELLGIEETIRGIVQRKRNIVTGGDSLHKNAKKHCNKSRSLL